MSAEETMDDFIKDATCMNQYMETITKLASSFMPEQTRDKKAQICHMYLMFANLTNLQKDGLLCDVKVIVEGESFNAHKAILASCSDFFKAMFSSGFKERHQDEVSLDIGKADDFRVLLECAYTGKVSLTAETAAGILEMAHYLQFEFATHRSVKKTSIP